MFMTTWHEKSCYILSALEILTPVSSATKVASQGNVYVVSEMLSSVVDVDVVDDVLNRAPLSAGCGCW